MSYQTALYKIPRERSSRFTFTQEKERMGWREIKQYKEDRKLEQ
jgi:hypothetical protein